MPHPFRAARLQLNPTPAKGKFINECSAKQGRTKFTLPVDRGILKLGIRHGNVTHSRMKFQ